MAHSVRGMDIKKNFVVYFDFIYLKCGLSGLQSECSSKLEH